MAATIGSGSVISRGTPPGAPASVRSNWFVIAGDLKTANTTGLLRPNALTTTTSLNKVTVPPGATRVLIRARGDVGVDAATSPVVVVIGEDENGVYTRLDNVDSDATGVTLTLTTTPQSDFMFNGTTAGTHYFWTDPTSLDGYDLKGSTYVWVLVETAATATDGGAATLVEAMGLFLN